MTTNSADYKCQVCHDVEWVEVGDVDHSMKPCPACHTQRQAERLQAMCGLNDSERQVTLFSIEPNGNGTTAMVQAAQKFIARPQGFLTIYGTCGNAKTLALQAIVNAMLAQGIGAIYTTFYDLVQWVREAFNDKENESAWRRVKKLQEIRVLVIDEVDKVKATEWVMEVETQLIDARYRDGLAGKRGTVLAMNGTPEQLSTHLQSRIYDGRNMLVKNSDSDMRRLMK